MQFVHYVCSSIACDVRPRTNAQVRLETEHREGAGWRRDVGEALIQQLAYDATTGHAKLDALRQAARHGGAYTLKCCIWGDKFEPWKSHGRLSLRGWFIDRSRKILPTGAGSPCRLIEVVGQSLAAILLAERDPLVQIIEKLATTIFQYVTRARTCTRVRVSLVMFLHKLSIMHAHTRHACQQQSFACVSVGTQDSCTHGGRHVHAVKHRYRPHVFERGCGIRKGVSPYVACACAYVQCTCSCVHVCAFRQQWESRADSSCDAARSVTHLPTNGTGRVTYSRREPLFKTWLATED